MGIPGYVRGVCCWQGEVVGRGYVIDLEFRAGHIIRGMVNWTVENRRDGEVEINSNEPSTSSTLRRMVALARA